jgi:hypothetical protein
LSFCLPNEVPPVGLFSCEKIGTVPSRKKLNLEKVLALLNTVCPKCGKVIQPSEIRRVGFDEMICPGVARDSSPSGAVQINEWKIF